MGDQKRAGDETAELEPSADRLDQAARQELVFAICHEIGNLVAAVQLEADLLGDADSPRAIASSSLRIEDLCAQVGGWLTQVRPVLSASARIQQEVDPASVISAVKSQLDWRGRGSATLRVDAQSGLPRVRIDPDSMRELVLAFAQSSLETGMGGTQLELAVRSHPGEVRFSVSDNGKVDTALAQWRESAQCGRALLCAVASHALRPVNGSVDVSREDGWTRILLSVPTS